MSTIGEGLRVGFVFHIFFLLLHDGRMRAVVNILSHFATLRKRKTTLLVSTTGDTGPAAVQAVSDVANPLLTILVHFPKGQISEFQRRQLTTVTSPCVRVVAFEGAGDDMDAPIKHILSTDKFPDRILCGVNSYNIGRPLMQMVHFVSVRGKCIMHACWNHSHVLCFLLLGVLRFGPIFAWWNSLASNQATPVRWMSLRMLFLLPSTCF